MLSSAAAARRRSSLRWPRSLTWVRISGATSRRPRRRQPRRGCRGSAPVQTEDGPSAPSGPRPPLCYPRRLPRANAGAGRTSPAPRRACGGARAKMRLRLPTIAGAVPLRLAHRLFWDYQARVVAAEDVSGVAAQNVALLRERGASSLTLLAEKIRCAQGVVSLVVDDRKHSCGNRLFFATRFSATTRLGLWSFPHRWRLGPED